MSQKEALNFVFLVVKIFSIKDWRFTDDVVLVLIIVIVDVLARSHHSVFLKLGSFTDTVKCMTSKPSALIPIEEVKNTRRGVELKLKNKRSRHDIFILVRLISNYSSPPVQVISPLSNEDLIH